MTRHCPGPSRDGELGGCPACGRPVPEDRFFCRACWRICPVTQRRILERVAFLGRQSESFLAELRWAVHLIREKELKTLRRQLEREARKGVAI